MDMSAWLRGLGLERYETAFRHNDVDSDVLPQLTADDLIGLGITSIGHRRKLLAAISALRSPLPTPGTSASANGRPGAPSPVGEGRVGGEAGAAPSSAERRQLTVMFCDLVGSTALASQLDPEDLREVISVYHRTVAEIVERFDGFVAKYMGDGVLAYFGYPRAHEDDAERAVRAALGLTDAVSRLDVKTVKLQARVGIATGLVVVGDLIGEGSAQEQSVVGETPNLAARLQVLAEPNTVVIASGTRRLVGDLFEYRDLGAIEVKGITAPVQAWRVLSPSAVASRFEALRGSVLTPLVGRDEEIALLLRRWERAKTGEGQVVLVSGEPGLGKSRIAVELRERIRGTPYFRQRFFCSPYRQDSALHPFIVQIGRAAEFARTDPSDIKLEKLEALLAPASLLDEDVAVIADLVSLPGSERYPLPDLSPRRRKERTLEALIRRLEGLSRRLPVAMIFEDAHWIDPTSRELLDLTVERVRSLPVLLIVTFRPEFRPSWSGEPHATTVVLNRLGRHFRNALVEQVAGHKGLPSDIVGEIVERTDGVPLFIEELTNSVLESGLLREEEGRYVHDGPLPPLTIPTSLQGSLMARLDRLASVRYLAQIGAAIGRWFRYTSLRAVAGLPESELQASVAQLVASGLVFQSGTPPDAIYTFKHALVQEAAYVSLLRKARIRLHRQIAQAFEAQLPELIDSQPELFARHYAEAGLAEKSVFYWRKAAQRSVAHSAMAEAAAQFQKGLDQVALLPDDAARRRQELELQSSLGIVLQSVKGYAAPETGRTLGRARELWEQLGSPSEFLQVSYAQSLYHSIVRQAGLYPQAASQAFLAIVLFCLGYPVQALERSSSAIAEARTLAHLPSLAVSLTNGARLLSFTGNHADLEEWAGQLVSVATGQGFLLWRAMGTIYRGWVRVNNGDAGEGLSLMRQGVAAYRATGAMAFVPYQIALLARACEIAGQVEEAADLLDESLQIVERTGERWLEAEQKGQLLLRQGQLEAAEVLYRKALSIARKQEAKLWELRAAVSLVRLWRDQGRCGQAHDVLAPVYGWFTEGFDTPDLKEAKALLDELA